MTESVRDRGEGVRGIAAGVAFMVVVFGAALVAVSIEHTLNPLRWLTAIPVWVWVAAWFGYMYWFTRKLCDIGQQQKEILRLLRERNSDFK